MSDRFRSRARHCFAVFTGTALIAIFAFAVPGSATAAPGLGSVGSGSSVPGPLQEDPGPLPPLRDDITVPKIVDVAVLSPRARRLTIESPAMRRTVGVEVLLPADTSQPRPTLYLLGGVTEREHTSAWIHIGGAPAFFADKNVNVV